MLQIVIVMINKYQGDGTFVAKQRPVKVLFSAPVPFITSISTVGRHSIALALDGSIYTWGHNTVGQLVSELYYSLTLYRETVQQPIETYQCEYVLFAWKNTKNTIK
jgi:alpha-tubulin suppressor-like RCC1 family protein